MNIKSNKSDKLVTKLFISLFPSQAIANGLPSINALANCFLIGRFLGESALAAFGFIGTIRALILCVSGIISSGTQVVSGKQLGRGSAEGMNKVFNTSVLLSFALSVLVSAAMLIFAIPLSELSGATGSDVIEQTASLMRGLALGFPLSILLSTTINFLQLERRDKVIGTSSVVMLAVNLGGNLANALWLNMGEFGIGLFMSLSVVCGVLINLFALLLGKNVYSVSLKHFSVKLIGRIVFSGSPGGTAYLTSLIRVTILNSFTYSVCGAVGVAAIAVTRNISEAVFVLLENGLNGSGRITAGILAGDRDTESLRQLHSIMAKSTWYMFAAAYIAVFILAEPLALLFGASPGNLELYVLAIRLYNTYALVEVFFTPPLLIYQGIGNNIPSHIIYLFNCVTFVPLAYWLFADRLGMILFGLSSVYYVILCYLGFVVYYIIKTHRFPRSPFKINYIPNSADAPGESRFGATISTAAQATEISEQVRNFCKQRGMNSKKAYYCALCIEEMAIDTVSYRMKKGNETIDLRIICDGENARIMLRDNCKHFNPNEWLKLCAPEDEYRSLGIKMVSELSREMRYVNTLGLNVLMIDI